MGLQQLNIHMKKKWTLTFTPYTEINVKAKTLKLPEEIAENLYGLGERFFFNGTQKTQT